MSDEPVHVPEIPPLFEPVRIDSARDLAEEASTLARSGAPEGTLVWTDTQTEGRARWGRSWESPPRGLYAGLILRPEFDWQDRGQIALVGLVSLGTAMASLVAPMTELRYRWPNALLVGGTRIAGLWLEEDRTGGWLTLLLSCNVETRPDAIFDGGCLLEEGGNPDMTPELLLEQFSRQFLYWLNLWAEEGMQPVLREFSSRSDRPGTPMALAIGRDEKIAGSLAGHDARGRLELEVNEERRTIPIRRFLGLPRYGSDDA
ncbi:MAG: biotin--[acetyl-CoA-carboxylase] ligase [Candidatus Wenzhouxiangella sp. M2_3B_020]